jgi:hypothetical protein
MDDTALEPLENALAEWEGHNIKLSVNESPELDELVDIDLAQCLGKADGARFPHRKLSAPKVDEKVRDFRKKDIFALHTVPKFDTLTFRHSDISPKCTSTCFSVTGFQRISTPIHKSSDQPS